MLKGKEIVAYIIKIGRTVTRYIPKFLISTYEIYI